MPGGMKNLEADITQFELLSILCHMHVKFCFGIGAVNNGSASGPGKVNMSTYKISMEMGLEDVFDRCFSFRCKLEVNIDIPQGINNCSLSFALHVIRCFTETTGIKLLNEHKKN